MDNSSHTFQQALAMQNDINLRLRDMSSKLPNMETKILKLIEEMPAKAANTYVQSNFVTRSHYESVVVALGSSLDTKAPGEDVLKLSYEMKVKI
jgi:hypothetical protein